MQHSVRGRRSPPLEQAVQHCSRGIHAVVVHIATRGNSIEDLKRGQGTVAADYCFRFAELENNHSLCLQSSSPAHHHRTQEAQPSPTGMWSLRTSWNRCGKHSTSKYCSAVRQAVCQSMCLRMLGSLALPNGCEKPSGCAIIAVEKLAQGSQQHRIVQDIDQRRWGSEHLCKPRSEQQHEVGQVGAQSN